MAERRKKPKIEMCGNFFLFIDYSFALYQCGCAGACIKHFRAQFIVHTSIASRNPWKIQIKTNESSAKTFHKLETFCRLISQTPDKPAHAGSFYFNLTSCIRINMTEYALHERMHEKIRLCVMCVKQCTSSTGSARAGNASNNKTLVQLCNGEVVRECEANTLLSAAQAYLRIHICFCWPKCFSPEHPMLDNVVERPRDEK